jgi:hypothetical protein
MGHRRWHACSTAEASFWCTGANGRRIWDSVLRWSAPELKKPPWEGGVRGAVVLDFLHQEEPIAAPYHDESKAPGRYRFSCHGHALKWSEAALPTPLGPRHAAGGTTPNF